MSTMISPATVGAPPPADAVTVGELGYIFRRQLWMFLLIVALGTGLALGLGLLQPNRYTATAMIVVQPRDNKIVGVNTGDADRQPVDAATLETHSRLLRSRELALRVIDKLSLADDPEFRPQESLVRPIDGGDGGERASILQAFQKRLDTSVSGKSYIIEVAFSADSPSNAARIVNAVAETYIALLREQTRTAAATATETFGAQLEKLRDEAQKAQAAVEAFKVENHIVTATGVDVNDFVLTQLNQELVRLASDAQEKAARLSRVVELSKRDGSIASVAAVVTSPLIDNLREQQVELARQEADARKIYGERHPEMVAIQAQRDDLNDKFKLEVERVIQDLRYQADIARRQEANARERIRQITESKAQVAGTSSSLATLEKQADVAQRTYEDFLRHIELTKQQAALGEAEARIGSLAAPPRDPDRLSLKLFGVIGLVGSTFLASLVAVFRDRMRGTVCRGRDLVEHAELPCLGLIPRLARRELEADSPVAAANGGISPFTESLRSLAITLERAGQERGRRVVAITSALPQEGKSFLAASLAVTLGRFGHRTLLIDLDLRRPTVGPLFNYVHDDPGVFEVIMGEREVDRCILRGARRVGILPAHLIPSDPVVVLASPKLRQVIDRLSREYDWVILDSPPTLGFSDARLVGQLAAFVVMVTRWDSTRIDALKVSVNDLRAFGVELAGGVVNDVDLKRHQAYGYGARDREGYLEKYSTYYYHG